MRRVFRVVVVEDNKLHRAFLHDALSALPYCAYDILQDGGEAMEYFKKALDKHPDLRPNLVFLDLYTPHTSGLEILQFVKDNPELRHIPIIIFSASTDEEDIRKAYHLQANCYIYKPSEASQFAPLLKEICEFWADIATIPYREEV